MCPEVLLIASVKTKYPNKWFDYLAKYFGDDEEYPQYIVIDDVGCQMYTTTYEDEDAGFYPQEDELLIATTLVSGWGEFISFDSVLQNQTKVQKILKDIIYEPITFKIGATFR